MEKKLNLNDPELNRIVLGADMTDALVDAAAVELSNAIQMLYSEYPDWFRAKVETEACAIFTTFNEGGQIIRTATLCDEFRRRHPR